MAFYRLTEGEKMRTETIPYEYYQFDELSDDAKGKAREWYRKGALDYDWWDYVYEDAKTIGMLMGIDIDKIYFSGFWSQGDGACFEGSYGYKKGSLKAVKEYAPQDEKLHNIVKDLQLIQKPNFYQLYATVRHSGYYQHSGCTDISVSRDSVNYQYMTEDVEDGITQTLREFMDWIYTRLEKEYEWLVSDEQVDESIRTNEYEFTKEGGIAK